MPEKLNAELILKAYKSGVFPMHTERGLQWFSPDPRGIFDLENFHIPKRLARKYRQGIFTIKINTAWDEVLFHCANRKNTWISTEIIEAYTELHKLGFAHSIEAYANNQLAGGLYGVSIGGAFMAESMFHLIPDASNFCLIFLAHHLKSRGFILLDTQDYSAHKERFGGMLIPRKLYLDKLAQAIELECKFVDQIRPVL